MMMMSNGTPVSQPVTNPYLNIFSVPDTDVSVDSYRIVPINPSQSSIKPVDFEIDQLEDYIDLNRSFFEIELKLVDSTGAALDKDKAIWPTNNLAHTLFKQINVRFNGTLISPQTDTYHYKAYIETLTNYDRDDGETILQPQGWYNAIDFPKQFTADNIDKSGNHVEWQKLTKNQQGNVDEMKKQREYWLAGNRRILRFKPNVEAFQLQKFLPPGIQISIRMYFNSPEVFMNSLARDGAEKLKFTQDEVKVKLYLCQVRLNPTTYRNLALGMQRNLAVYPTVRSDIRTFNIPADDKRYECDNLFQGRIPNRLIVVLVESDAFNGKYQKDPFVFQKSTLTEIRQIIRGEEYPYEPLELEQANMSKNMRGYYRFLQATGCFCHQRGNMVRAKDWGGVNELSYAAAQVNKDANCTLFVFDNVANGCIDSPRMNPRLAGDLRVILEFGSDSKPNLTVILFGEFENLMEIDNNKSVVYKVYQTIKT